VTADQPAVANAIGDAFETPVVLCDPVVGLRPGNEAGAGAIAEMCRELDPAMAGDPVTALQLAAEAPEDTLLVLLAGDRALSEPRPAIAALLIRDAFAQTGRTLVSVGAGWAPAAELGSDVYVIRDALPTDSIRRELIAVLLGDAGVDVSDEQMLAAIAFTRGLSRFAVEQTVSLALSKDGLDVDVLAAVWVETVNAIPGLRVLSTGRSASMDDIAGLDEHKRRATRLTNGKGRPDVVIFVDELEKALAGSSGAVADSSGASQAVLGGLLSTMEDTESIGEILVGPPGTGKSHCAKTVGAAAGVPTLQFDPGQVKGSLVGQTEQNMATFAAFVRAMGGSVYWIATSNQLETVPPEVIRRFTEGTTFVDLPQAAELQALWAMYLAKYELSDDAPDAAASDGYSGADVRNVCRTAWRDEQPLSEVMASYVPSSYAQRERIDSLRRKAAGAYRSASYPGAYRLPTADAAPAKKGRKLNIQ
jgi:hypothetical protein